MLLNFSSLSNSFDFLYNGKLKLWSIMNNSTNKNNIEKNDLEVDCDVKRARKKIVFLANKKSYDSEIGFYVSTIHNFIKGNTYEHHLLALDIELSKRFVKVLSDGEQAKYIHHINSKNYLHCLLKIRQFLKCEKVELVYFDSFFLYLIISFLSLCLLFPSFKKIYIVNHFNEVPFGIIKRFLFIFFRPNQFLFGSKFLFQNFTQGNWIKRIFADFLLLEHRAALTPFAIENFTLDYKDVVNFRKKYLHNHKYLLISIGRFRNRKRFLLLIEAINYLRHKFPSGDHIVKNLLVMIIGETKTIQEESNKKEIENIVYKYNLHDSIRFLSYVDDMGAALEAADVYVNSANQNELFSIAMGEALAHETLVIAHNKGGHLDYCINRKNCLLINFEAQDAYKNLAFLLMQILHDFNKGKAEFYKKISETGKKIVKEKYSKENLTKGVEEIYLKNAL